MWDLLQPLGHGLSVAHPSVGEAATGCVRVAGLKWRHLRIWDRVILGSAK